MLDELCQSTGPINITVVIGLMQKILLLLVFTLLSSINIAAANVNDQTPVVNTYQLELIVYSHINAKTLSSEQWPFISPSSIQMSSLQDNHYLDYLNQIQWQSVNNSDLFLNNIVQKLQQANYPILLHLAWQEQVPADDKAKPIHIYGGSAFADDGSVLTNVTNESSGYAAYNHWQLDGEVTISLKRYFNLRFNLLFTEPLNALKPFDQNNYFANSNNPFIYFHELQTRRTRSGELNYVDSPLYGILFEVKKVDASNSFSPVAANPAT